MVNQRSFTAPPPSEGREGQASGAGLDLGFATNTLGTFAVTAALAPALARCPGSRVVIVSSGGM